MNVIYLQANGSLFTNGFFMIAMLLVMVVFLILPQRKRAKEQKTFMASLEKGKEVVTASGILGRIVSIDDQIVTINVGNKTNIRVTRNAISKELTDAIYPK